MKRAPTPTQKDLTLSLLRRVGRRGWHSSELRAVHHIGDPAKRVSELIEEGHRIERRTERRNGRHGSRYILLPNLGVGFPPSVDAMPGAVVGRSPQAIDGAGSNFIALADVEQACALAREKGHPDFSLEEIVLACPVQGQMGMAA